MTFRHWLYHRVMNIPWYGGGGRVGYYVAKVQPYKTKSYFVHGVACPFCGNVFVGKNEGTRKDKEPVPSRYDSIVPKNKECDPHAPEFEPWVFSDSTSSKREGVWDTLFCVYGAE